jgi:hypothetical protein
MCRFFSLRCSWFYISFGCTPPYFQFALKSEFTQHVGLIQLGHMTIAKTAVPVYLLPIPPGGPGGGLEQLRGRSWGGGTHPTFNISNTPFVPCMTFPKLFVLSQYSPT